MRIIHFVKGKEPIETVATPKNKLDVDVVCSECGCPMKYCEVCDTYHHADSFQQDHEDYQNCVNIDCA